MKVIDLLKIQREPLKVMSDCGLKVEDYGYIAMYEEYRERRSHNEKYRYVIMCLSMKYHISESKVKRIIRRLEGEFIM